MLIVTMLALIPLESPGAVMAVGGGTTTPVMVQAFFRLMGGPDRPILILSQTHEDPATGSVSKEMLERQGAKQVTLCSSISLTLSERRVLASQILSSAGVWIPGGNQNLLMERFGPEWIQQVFPAALERGVCFFGTSAGAALMSNPMMGGTNEDGSAKIVPGSGLLPILIDTHYRERNRQARFHGAIENLRPRLAVGLDAGEWIVWRDGAIREIHGHPEIVSSSGSVSSSD